MAALVFWAELLPHRWNFCQSLRVVLESIAARLRKGGAAAVLEPTLEWSAEEVNLLELARATNIFPHTHNSSGGSDKSGGGGGSDDDGGADGGGGAAATEELPTFGVAKRSQYEGMAESTTGPRRGTGYSLSTQRMGQYVTHSSQSKVCTRTSHMHMHAR